MVPDRPPGEDPFAAILRGIADARVDDAATARSRAHWLERQVDDEATLAGAFVDLAERRVGVKVRVRGGFEAAGAVTTIGADVVMLQSAAGVMLVRLDRVVTLRSDAGLVPSPTRRVTPAGARTMLDVLRETAGESATVRVHADDGTVIRGILGAVGVDVLTLRVGDARPATVLVVLDAVSLVEIAQTR